MVPHSKDELQQRKEELQKNAEIAYTQVPTQEEMLNGGKPVEKPADKEENLKKTEKSQETGHKHHDQALAQDIDEALYEAAQQGNIGGD